MLIKMHFSSLVQILQHLTADKTNAKVIKNINLIYGGNKI